jgi:HD-GYP domain-containing protein (c-di-GMP phosphodiesterase class II)
MRRMTLKYAKPGMVVELPVYDNFGSLLLPQHKELDSNSIKNMIAKGVPEIFVRDYRVTDILVAPLYSPQSEGVLANAFKQVVQKKMQGVAVDAAGISRVYEAVNQMVRDMSLNVIGDTNVSCNISPQDYVYLQPVKTAGLAMTLGQIVKLSENHLAVLGMAAVFKDIGLDPAIIDSVDSIAEGSSPRMRGHPVAGYKFLLQYPLTAKEVADAVLQHHENWSGSGYAQGLKGKEISAYARIIAIADVFVDLLAARPGRGKYMPHEAIEYIMAGSGDQFDPQLVEAFVRQIPSYPTGLVVHLNTGETCIVSSPKRGYVARPIVRVCSTAEKGTLKEPYDMDLSIAKYQRKLITQVLEYD